MLKERTERKRNSIEFKVYGRYALFSDPIMKVGGEKFSYQIPTYEAIKGIVESIYWKPTIIWHVDAVRVMRKIQTESKGMKPIKMSGGNDLSYYTYLRDVEYRVLAHFEFNNNYPELLKADGNENKHHNIAKRAVKKGGRRDIFLGTRECQAFVEPCEFEEGDGFYDDYGRIDFGNMFHGFDYPNETGKPELCKRFWQAYMVDGVVKYTAPADCKVRSKVRDMEMIKFREGKNFTPADKDLLIEDLMAGGPEIEEKQP